MQRQHRFVRRFVRRFDGVAVGFKTELLGTAAAVPRVRNAAAAGRDFAVAAPGAA